MIALTIAALVVSASGPSVEEHIDHAQKSLDNLEYDAAADELMLAATDPAATEEQKLRANLLAGICNRIIGRDVDARLNFRYVLSRKPDSQLPKDVAPKVAAFFELCRQELAGDRANTAATPKSAPDVSPGDATKAAAALNDRPKEVVGGLGRTADQVGPTASWILVGVGALATLGGAGTAGACELLLGDPSKPAADRIQFVDVGQKALLVGAVGVVVAAGGGALLALESN